MENIKILKLKNVSLAALLIASATLAACSSSDDNIIEEQPVNPTAPKTYTMIVQATKGDDAGTRGLSLDGKTLGVKWNEGEEVIVAQDETTIGTLKAQASNNGTTTLTGEVTGLDPNKDVSFYLHSVNRRYDSIFDGPSHIYWEQKGVLQKPAEGRDHSIETNYDFAACTVSKEKISINGNEISVAGGIALASRQAIVKFTLLDQDGNALDDVYRLKIKTPKGNYLTLTSSYMNAPELGDEFYSEVASTNEVFMAVELNGKQDLRLIAYIDKGDAHDEYYFYDRENVEFKNGKYYEITVKMKPGVYIDHYGYTYNAKNGDVLFGNNTDIQIKIAAGATVTLHDIHIADDSYIDCQGDATIILEGENSICAAKNNPAIWVDEGKTLTIKGTGSLDAENEGWAAGIGGGETLPCGNIVIESGTIVAKGGESASGIGSGGHDADGIGATVAEQYAETTCGNIEIKGGHITATGDSYGAGIGCGGRGTCGNITITGGTIIATGGDQDSAGIGGANASTCGDITITGGTVTATGHWGCPGIGMGGNGTATDHTICGDITIGGTANVTANRGSSAMHAIGFSYNEGEDIQKTCGTITIGGTVYYNGSTKTWVSEELENALKVATFTWPTP